MDDQILEDGDESPVIVKSRVRAALNKPIDPDLVLLLGFGVCLYGWFSGQYWLILGGVLFFLLGCQALGEKKEEGGRQGDGEGTENPLGRPPS